MRVALIHDWLNGMRGGEKILEVLCELFPAAPIYTLLYEPREIHPSISGGRIIHTSWLQRWAITRKNYRKLLPLLPSAVEKFPLDAYDVVISSSHCVANGVRAASGACHISYCHTPMRYLWDLQEEYFGRNSAKRMLLAPVLSSLRRWDVRAAGRVKHFIANSRFVAERIQRIYGRDSEVIHPPVDTSFFTPDSRDKAVGDYFLLVSALVPYKKVELVLETFRRIKDRLVIIGTGPGERALRRKAPANAEFLGWADQETLRRYYRGCRALLFPQKEDFGIVPLEAQACGRPVIAFSQGGALETIVPSTGIFFAEQTPLGLQDAIQEFKRVEHNFDPVAVRTHALAFDKKEFREKLRNFILSKVPAYA